MEREQYMEVLLKFVTGGLTVRRLQDFIEERLLDLRQSSEMTEEKRLLSKIELYLHEAAEGLRPQFDVYILAQSIVDRIPTRANVKTSFRGSPVPLKFGASKADKTVQLLVPSSR